MKNIKLNATEKTVFEDFVICGQNAKKWMRKCVLLLPKIEKMRIWEKKGFKDIYDFAMKLAGMSRNKVNESLRVLHEAEDLPEIQKVIEKKGIWAVKPVIRVVTPETQGFWAEKAETMSHHVLETYVRDFQRDSENSISPNSNRETGRHVAAKNDDEAFDKPNIFQKLEKFEIKLKAETVARLTKVKGKDGWETLMQEFLEYKESKEKQIEAELAAENPEKVKTDSRHVPKNIEKYVKKRSRGYCEMPGCTKKGEHLHHTTPFALCHEHDPDKIRFLCEEHHAIAHQGLIENEDESTKNWKVQKFSDITDLKSVVNERVAKFRRRF